MDWKKVAGVIVILLVLFWVIETPANAADTVNSVLDWLVDAANSVIRFVNRVFQ